MTLTAPFDSLPSETQTALAEIMRRVIDVFPRETRSWMIDTAQLPERGGDCTYLKEVTAWAGDGKCFLYYIDGSEDPVEIAAVETAFSAARKEPTNGRALPRHNGGSACWYVGSSQAIAKRFREHLGYGARQTYALHLRHWTPPGVRVKFVCARYPRETPWAVLHALEDTLWETRRPMFGRQGRR